MSCRTRRKFCLSLFPIPMNGHKQKPTIAPLSIYARNTLCLLHISIFPFTSILRYCSELPSSIAPKLQIRSDRTARHSTLSFDFQQTDLNDFPGVGISTRCFCLNYPILPTSFKPTAPTTTIDTSLHLYSTTTLSTLFSLAQFCLLHVRHIFISPHQQRFVVYYILHPDKCLNGESNGVSRVPFPFIIFGYYFILFCKSHKTN